MFSHPVCCLFICWWFPLLCKNFLVWCIPTCLFFLSFPLSKEIYQKKLLPRWMSEIFLPMFSSKSFMFLSFTFKSLIQTFFEFIWCKKVILFYFVHVSVQFFQYHLLSRLCLSYCMPLSTLLILIDHIGIGLFLGYYLRSILKMNPPLH